jgi:hypothetical protein
MFEFGRYTLSYQPPEGAVEAAVDMSISAEADLPQMMRFFESFLQAAGYVIEGKELTLERPAPEFDIPDFPYSLGDTIIGDTGSDTLSFGAVNFAGMWGGMGNDVIKF